MNLESGVYWLGGSPCAGKSSIADAIADRFGLRVYRPDHAWDAHARRASAASQPVLHRLHRASAAEIFLRSPDVMLEDSIRAYEEEWPLIVADLNALPDGPPVVAEGAALMPDLVARVPGAWRRAVWVVPEEAFQREHYARREWARAVAESTGDAAAAFEGWMRRDAAFARVVRERAAALGFATLVVSAATPLAANIERVIDAFGLNGGGGA